MSRVTRHLQQGIADRGHIAPAMGDICVKGHSCNAHSTGRWTLLCRGSLVTLNVVLGDAVGILQE